MKKIGVIGCGVIGQAVAEFAQKKLQKKARIIALCDIDSKRIVRLSKKIKPRPLIANLENLVKKSDLIVESANKDIVGAIIEKAILYKKDVLIMSTGGLLGKKALLKRARERGCNIYIPSGAICGLDGLGSAVIGKVKKVSLTTRKPPKGLKDVAFLKRRKIKDIKKQVLLYEGNAREAVKYFPQNINVAATLSLLGIGARRTKVKIISSPDYTRNIHEVQIEGEFGRIFTRTENLPSKNNPRTSQLAIFSAIAKLKEIVYKG